MLASEAEIKLAYRDEATASRYIAERFENELNLLLHERQVAAVQRSIDCHRPERTLEIAPGPGRLTRHLQPSGLLACLEYNEAMIGEGRKAAPSESVWIRGDGFRLPFAVGFDLIYSFRFIRHFHRRPREWLYEEIRRLLRPGGIFLMDAVNRRVSAPLREKRPDDYPIYDKLYRRGELIEELRGAGFEPISTEPVQKFYRCQSLCQNLLGPRSHRLNRLAIRGLERLPRGDGLEWIVTCRRA
jgi:SAM-dependent methyltransferase